jgi:hypothetical protein
MIRHPLAAVAALALAGCDLPRPPPVVSAYNEASVEIQQDSTIFPSRGDDPTVIAEAQRICATANRRAEYASSRSFGGGYHGSTTAHLFLCLRR